MAKKSQKRAKPNKPYPSFPLTAHNNGQWCKKIRGKVHFFGTWDDPQVALENYLHIAGDLHAGRKPRETSLLGDAITVKDVCNRYLTDQLHKQQSGEIRPRWFEDCRKVVEHFAREMGSGRPIHDLGADDFLEYRQQLEKKGLAGKRGLGVHALTRALSVVRSMLSHAYEVDLIDRPVKVGKSLQGPPARLRRRHQQQSRLEAGLRMFEPPQARRLIEEADIPLRAMILLGLNGGFGNTDCARLPVQAVNLRSEIIEFSRPKTGVDRRVPLWPETVTALRDCLDDRLAKVAPGAQDLVFVTDQGDPWIREHIHTGEDGVVEKIVSVDLITRKFSDLLTGLGLKRRGLSFYALRHTFRTLADETNDQHAIHLIMGQAIPGMSGVYVERIEADRLRAVVDHVRSKIFGPDEPTAG